ncbi:transposase [Mesorhizobium tamadayense]|uniref:transposase n=1 Tax=Mesorhizobium tamadayense TaxID=425306 RepID=UPI0026A1190C
MRAAMSAQRNETDKADGHCSSDAHGLNSPSLHQVRELLPDTASADAPAQSEGQVPRLGERHPALIEVVRHPLGQGWRGAFEQAVRTAVVDDPLSAELMDAMLSARALWRQYCRLHDLVVKTVGRSEPCRRFMAIPGVGPVTALSFMTAIDDPTRFRRSRDVAAYFGLTSGPRSTFRAASRRLATRTCGARSTRRRPV